MAMHCQYSPQKSLTGFQKKKKKIALGADEFLAMLKVLVQNSGLAIHENTP
jgi:hypothetical protein